MVSVREIREARMWAGRSHRELHYGGKNGWTNPHKQNERWGGKECRKELLKSLFIFVSGKIASSAE